MGLVEIAVVLIVTRPANIQGWPLREEHTFYGNPDRAWVTCMTIKALTILPRGSVAYCIRQVQT